MKDRPARLPFIAFGLVAIAGVLIQACGNTPPGAGPVAVWDGGRLEQDDYRAWIARQKVKSSQSSVRNLVFIMSMATAARQRGLEDSAGVELAVEAMRHASLLPALKRHIDAQVSISDEELDQLAVRYPEAFRQPRKLFLRGIYKRLPSGEPERATVRSRMQALRAQVVNGADVRRLAVRESESQSRFREGSIGFVDPAGLPAPVRESVEGLESGDVSEVIEFGGGLAFYVCERIKPEIVPDAEQVRFKFRQNLFRQRSAEMNKALMEKLDTRIRIRLETDPVLRVEDYGLPADWLDALISQRLPERVPTELSARQKRRLLQEWGRRVAMADHAESLGLDERESVADTMRWNRIHALAAAELRSRVDARLRPPAESALRELYEQRRERLHNPIGFRVAAIQFAGADGPKRPEVIARARDTLAAIRAGHLDFGQAARDLSVHPSAGNGGLLGWMTTRELGAVDVNLLKPVRELSPGEDTGLLRLQDGLWAVKLLERRPATPMSFDEAREHLEQAFREDQIKRLETEVREQHLADIGLRILD